MAPYHDSDRHHSSFGIRREPDAIMSARADLLRLAENLCIEADMFRPSDPDMAETIWNQARGIIAEMTDIDPPETLPRSMSLVPISVYQTPMDDPEFDSILRKMQQVAYPDKTKAVMPIWRRHNPLHIIEHRKPLTFLRRMVSKFVLDVRAR